MCCVYPVDYCVLTLPNPILLSEETIHLNSDSGTALLEVQNIENS